MNIFAVLLNAFLNESKRCDIYENINNKLASLEATLVRNSAHPLTHLLTHRGKV